MTIQVIFDIIGSVSLLIIAVFLCLVFYYLIKILRDVSKVTYQLREKSEQFAGLVSALIIAIKKTIVGRKKKK